jgi:IS5 family transposase
MLRTYFLQQWFNLSDPGVEEALYESPVLRRFVGVDPGVAAPPDETTVCRFRHLLEKHDLGGQMLEAVNLHLETKGIRIARGTIVDATIVQAPSATRNQSGERDPAMHQTKKGKQWYFGLKAHIGVDSKQGVVHSVCTSAANVADMNMLPDLLHGEETKVWGDGGYQGQTKAIKQAAPKAHDMTCRRTKFKNYVDEEARRKNTTNGKFLLPSLCSLIGGISLLAVQGSAIALDDDGTGMPVHFKGEKPGFVTLVVGRQRRQSFEKSGLRSPGSSGG